jgi:hypothetical protein
MCKSSISSLSSLVRNKLKLKVLNNRSRILNRNDDGFRVLRFHQGLVIPYNSPYMNYTLPTKLDNESKENHRPLKARCLDVLEILRTKTPVNEETLFP